MSRDQNRPRLIIGVILVLLGIFFLFGEFLDQVFHIRINQYVWPLTILVPGVLIYLMAFITDVKAGRNLITVGSIISAVGFLLFVQNLTGWWATWAYAWALIFPTSIGLGQMLFGLLRQQDDLLREGWRLTRIGLVILLVGVVFFELLIGISGFRFFGLRGFCFPALLVIFGLVVIFRNLLAGGRSTKEPLPTPPPAGPDSISTPVPSQPVSTPAEPIEWEPAGEDIQDEKMGS